MTSTMGLVAQLERPLDFLVIADHAVALGVTQQIYSGNPKLLSDPTLNRWNKMMNADLAESQKATREFIDGHSAGTNPDIMSDAEVMQPIMQSVGTRAACWWINLMNPGDSPHFTVTSTPQPRAAIVSIASSYFSNHGL